MSSALERILKRMARRARQSGSPVESRAPTVKVKPRPVVLEEPPQTETVPNRLAAETSPYLLQHAFNPVDWYPWGEEALSRAREEDRPILLSIGYSACHWCHVMERESFEDAQVAAVMNRDFVCIKVDREERPDLDEIYMRAVQTFTGGYGGWPMTVFLAPDGRPFMGGTYYPPYPKYGMPSFQQVMDRAVYVYSHQKDDLDRLTGGVVERLHTGGSLPSPAEELVGEWLPQISVACEADFDSVNGGFGGSPKFPPHGALSCLLADWSRSKRQVSLDMATRTLDAMAQGGMYDVIGGGFARYSVDEEWRIPHFEKMLCDNAQLVPNYVDAWRSTGSAFYARIACETLDYVLREMRLDGGGFAASQDADSEGEEGKYFVWTARQFVELLGEREGRAAAELLGVGEGGNFEYGTSVIRPERSLESVEPEERAFLEKVLPRLLAHREKRIAPDRDGKVLASWNALMITAFAKAGAALDRADYLEAAEQAAAFLLTHLVVDGRLMRSWGTRPDGSGGHARHLGYLDDYAALSNALIDLYEATFEEDWLDLALHYADGVIELFWDEEDGGCFYTGSDAEALITRSKNLLGGAEPSGNGLAALAFSRLAVLCGREDLGERADRILCAYQPLVEPAARALGCEALAATWRTGRVMEVGVVGEADDPGTRALLDTIRKRFLPFAVVARLDPGAESPHLPWMKGRSEGLTVPTAFVCEDFRCRLPVTTEEELAAQLDAGL